MDTEGTSLDLRSEGYEMGLVKGRAFSAMGTFESAACRRRETGHSKKKCEITMEGMYLL